MAEHRVPMLGAALRRRVDPERSRDPQIRELVTALSTLEIAPAPRADFRAELRAQLVAVTPRLVEEGDGAAATTGKATAERAPRPSGFRFAKPLMAAASVLVAFALLLGGAVLLSRKALPGDALYSVKRASENTQYGLTGGARAKGKLKLEFAGRRIGEVASLLPRAAALAAGTGALADDGQLNSSTTTLVRQTLASANSDVQTGSQLLGGAAVQGNSSQPLDTITDWTPGEVTAMNKIIARIPTTSKLHANAVASRTLIEAAQQRATTLKTELGCGCLSDSRSDNLGPIPCATKCSPGTPTVGPKGTPSSRQSGSGATATPAQPSLTSQGGTSARSTAPTPARGATGGAASSPASTSGVAKSAPRVVLPTTPKVPGLPKPSGLPTLPKLQTTLPTLPIGKAPSPPGLPITTNSTCASVALGGLHVGLC